MVSRFENLYFRQGVVLNEIRFPFLLQIAGKKEMPVALIDHQTHRIIVLVCAVMFVIIVVQNFHFNAVGKFVNFLRAVLFVPTLKSGVMRRSRFDFRVAVSDIFFVSLCIFVRAWKIDDDLAFVAVKDTRRRIASRKPCNMILVGMRRDDVFEYSVRAVLVDILRSRIRT